MHHLKENERGRSIWCSINWKQKPRLYHKISFGIEYSNSKTVLIASILMKHTFHWHSRTGLTLFSVANHHWRLHWRLMLLGQRVFLLFLIASWRNVCDYFSGNWKRLMISCATASWFSGLSAHAFLHFGFLFTPLELWGFLPMHRPVPAPPSLAMLQQEHGRILSTHHTIVSASQGLGTFK